eukprot:scaffold22305_cov54-Phaeocystis_antarctica.AAC.4
MVQPGQAWPRQGWRDMGLPAATRPGVGHCLPNCCCELLPMRRTGDELSSFLSSFLTHCRASVELLSSVFRASVERLSSVLKDPRQHM